MIALMCAQTGCRDLNSVLFVRGAIVGSAIWQRRRPHTLENSCQLCILCVAMGQLCSSIYRSSIEMVPALIKVKVSCSPILRTSIVYFLVKLRSALAR